jgi:hypothetical protein
MNASKWTRSLLGMALVGLMACGGGEPAEEEVSEEAAPPEATAPAAPSAPALDPTELQTNAAAHEGEQVSLSGMNVQSTVGTSAVWVELPNKNPFLVHFAAPPIPAAGRRVDLVGTVHAITPDVVNGWVSSGAITENDKLVVEFATHYLEAESVTAAP